MCRLLGVSFGHSREDITLTEIALRMFPALVGQGPDAFGWMSHKTGEPMATYFKKPGSCVERSNMRLIKSFVPKHADWFVGHTRLATIGDPENNLNNHPLLHGNILGVHNGTIKNYQEVLEKTGRTNQRTKVDSEAIFAAVNRWGPTKGLRKLRGNMVTIYTDLRRPHVLHVARSQRYHLHLAWSERGNLFWATEKQALRKLEPEVKLVHWSEVSEKRLLVVRAGKIIQRHRYAPLEPVVEHDPFLDFEPPMSDDLFEDWLHRQNTVILTRLQRDRAVRRGSLLFPDAPQRIIPGTADRTFYYQGVWMNREEYDDAVTEDEINRLLLHENLADETL